MQVFYCTPYSLEKNLGKEYNKYVELLTKSDNDWCFFIDGDVQFLDPFWGKQVGDLISKYPDTGIFTCYTNRVGNLQQCLGGVRSENSNILQHYTMAQLQKSQKYDSVKRIDRVISGHFFGFSRKTYNEVGGFTENQEILKVDNRFSRKVLGLGKTILLMEGLYAFHYYRLHTPENVKKQRQHLL